MRILSVCTGNMCRSPLFERLLDHRAHDAGLSVAVSSAGTKARNGGPIHPETHRLIEHYGADPENFSSRLLTPRLIAGHDLVVGAAREHRDAVQEFAPSMWKKVYTMTEIAELAHSYPDVTLAEIRTASRGYTVPVDRLDVRDPIGHSAEIFEQTGAEISDAVDAIVELLLR